MGNIKLFENKKVRSEWNDQEHQWYFSIIDVIEVLTESPRPRKYWNALKTKILEEGYEELSQNLGQLKMRVNFWKVPKHLGSPLDFPKVSYSYSLLTTDYSL
jgi:DNA-damage-inducible protein D